MISSVELVKAEEITLQEMAINHRFKNTRRRATGLLMLARGDTPKVVCEALGVSDQSVYKWYVRHEVACRSCPHGNGGDHPCHRVNL
jgi:hypothetical protein